MARQPPKQESGKKLSQEQLAEVYSRLWVPINLNSTSEAEILLIPGVGPRLLHEFEDARGGRRSNSPESEGFFSKVKELWDDLTE